MIKHIDSGKSPFGNVLLRCWMAQSMNYKDSWFLYFFSIINNLRAEVCLSWTPVYEVCINHEVLVFQPRTWDSHCLGSVFIVTPFIRVLLPHLFQPFFWIDLFPSFVLPPPPSVTARRCITSICCTCSPPLLPAQIPSTWTSSMPATRQPLSLYSSPRSVCLRLPLFTASIRI